MSDCFWTEFDGTSDPDCGGPPATIFSAPAVLWDSHGGTGGEPINFNDGLFSDAGLTSPLTAATARVTSIKVYDATSFGNCDFVCWISCVIGDGTMTSNCVPSCPEGSDSTAPPLDALTGTFTVALDFDPTGLVPTDDIIAAASVSDINNTVLAATVHTDVGNALYIFGGSTCF